MLLDACVHAHIHIYSLLELVQSYNATCSYIFRADHLALGIELVCSSLEKTTSPIPSFPQLPIDACVGLRPHRPFPAQPGTIIGVNLAQLAFGQSCS